jgi:hypothetical protein
MHAITLENDCTPDMSGCGAYGEGSVTAVAALLKPEAHSLSEVQPGAVHPPRSHAGAMGKAVTRDR